MKKIVVLLACIFFLSSCSVYKGNQGVRKTEYLLGTMVSLTVYDFGTADKSIIDECFSLVLEYEHMFSYYDQSGELYYLNQNAYKHPFKMSNDMFEIISESLYYCQKTDGAFDIGLGKVIEAWDNASFNEIPPMEDELSSFVGFKGYEHITVDNKEKTVFFNDERTAVHLGACAKGFVQDKAVSFLRNNGVKSALLDFGGSIYAIGSKNGNPFSIGITNPSSDGGLAGTIEISDESVVTSGNYRRFFEYEGTVYHHIIDSETAYPSVGDINGVSVICKSAFKGDCLSTAAFVLGSERAAMLLDEENLGYIIITDKVVCKSGVILKNEK